MKRLVYFGGKVLKSMQLADDILSRYEVSRCEL